MTVEQPSSAESRAPRSRLRRFAPVALVALAMAAVFASGAHRHISLETLVRHRMAIDAFMTHHMLAALGAFIAIYIVVVALSIPGGLLLTITGGILFGTLLGGAASVTGATIGGTLIFLVARSACGETLVRRAGPLACKIAEGFRADAFSYLLFLRLVPAFPFFLVNLVPAVAGVKLRTFVAATIVGIIPATFAFASVGAGLASTLVVKEVAFRACLERAGSDCAGELGGSLSITPELILSFLAVLAVGAIPLIVKRLRARQARSSPAPLT